MVPYLLKAVSPAGPIINRLTFLQKLPQALSPFKREENKQFERVKVAFYEALQDVKDRVAAGTAKDSWSKLWLDGEKKEKANVTLNWHEAAHAIGSSSFVAIATIGGPLHCFSRPCATIRPGRSRFKRKSTASVVIACLS
jgi:hypothetical protein